VRRAGSNSDRHRYRQYGTHGRAIGPKSRWAVRRQHTSADMLLAVSMVRSASPGDPRRVIAVSAKRSSVSQADTRQRDAARADIMPMRCWVPVEG
jgi:hypothetical protein